MIKMLILITIALVFGAWAVIDLLIHASSSLIRRAWRWYQGSDIDSTMATYRIQPEDEAATDAMKTWLRNGDPLQDAPQREMGVWLTPEQADELDALAAETWPRSEYFAIADLYIVGETS